MELFLMGHGLTYDTLVRTINENIKQFNEYTKADFELLQLKIENLELKNNLLLSHLTEQKLYKEEIIIQENPPNNETNTENYIIQKLKELENQNKEILKTLNINQQSKLLTGFGELNKTVGPRLLQINPETLTINKIYETVADCLKVSNFKNKRPSIEKAIMENTIYNGYRWLYAERNEDPEEAIKTIQPTKETKTQNLGYIAKINKEKTTILNLYIDRKTASIENGYPVASSLDNPVKMGSLTKNHYYVLFDNCDDALKDEFIEKNGIPLLYKDGVGQFDVDNKLITEFVCKYDCIKQLHIGDKTLSKILNKNILYNNNYYKSIGSRLYY
jgi:hypothetical protein